MKFIQTLKGLFRKLKSWLLWKLFGRIRAVKPTGSTSLTFGSSSGLEPLYNTEYHRMIKINQEPK